MQYVCNLRLSNLFVVKWFKNMKAISVSDSSKVLVDFFFLMGKIKNNSQKLNLQKD